MFERLYPGNEIVEEQSGVRNRYVLCLAELDNTCCLTPRRRAARPERRVAVAGAALERPPESCVPIGRPAADDQSVLVKDAVEQALDRRVVAIELLERVLDP